MLKSTLVFAFIVSATARAETPPPVANISTFSSVERATIKKCSAEAWETSQLVAEGLVHPDYQESAFVEPGSFKVSSIDQSTFFVQFVWYDVDFYFGDKYQGAIRTLATSHLFGGCELTGVPMWKTKPILD